MSLLEKIAFNAAMKAFENHWKRSCNHPEIGYCVVLQFEEIERLFGEKKLFENIENTVLSKKLRDLAAVFPETTDTKIATYISSGEYISDKKLVNNSSWKTACFLNTAYCLSAQGYSLVAGKAYRTGGSLGKLRPYLRRFDQVGAILFGQHHRAQEYAH